MVRGELPSRALPLDFDFADPASSASDAPLSLFGFYRACQDVRTQRAALLARVVEQLAN